AGLVLGTGIAAMFSAHGKITSNNAVISTNLVSLRAPIDGTVSGLPTRAGSMVAKGALIAHIEDPRVNDAHLVDLRARQTRVEADLKGAEANRAALMSLQSELVRRDTIHTRVNSERLAKLVEEAKKTRAARAAKHAQAQNDVDRRLPLEVSGIVAKAEMYRLRSALEAARQESAAQAARLAALRTEAEAAAQGVLAGTTGGTDKSYSAQRADQIAMEISSLTKTIAALTAEASETASRLSAEERRTDLLRSAKIVAPSAGMIWKLGAADGERLGTGDMVAEIVDCNTPFLLASIPQDRFSDVEIGGTAKFRLSGERTERSGTVDSVTGHGDLLQGHHYAVMPLDEPLTVIATIALPQGKSSEDGNKSEECLIGRSARVLLPATGGGLIDQILRRVF
ncbi:MAG: HlyD family secretion protein, partial [Beijerinckiaceae bacterium]|nr:HlyD family secretion protein [Beijerinckiaceae bacterium]